MNFNLIYHADVKRVDLPKIDMKDRSMIKRAIEERLATRPEVFGKPLQRTLKGYWRLRVGEYRVVFKIVENDILILGIVHRKDVYQRVPPASPGRELWRAGSAEERSYEALWARRGLWRKEKLDPEKCQKQRFEPQLSSSSTGKSPKLTTHRGHYL